MIGRWSLLVRIGALIAIGLFVIQLMLVVAIFVNRGQDTGGGFRYPLPDQIVAMVELAESIDDRAVLLRALNSSDFSVMIEDAKFEDFSEESVRVPRVESVLNRYHDRVGGRRLVAFISMEGPADPWVRWRDEGIWSNHPLRMVIEMSTGELLVVESRGGKLSEKVFSWPLGLFSGAISVVVALLVLWAVGRETRPLRRLGTAALHFAQTGEQRPLPEQGAPEIRRLVADFNNMQARIGELLDARALMLGALGHDLRTYLTRIQLRIGALPETETRIATERDLAQMNQLVDDSLTLARLGIEGPQAASTDATRLLRELVDDYVADGADLQIVGELPISPALVPIAEGMFRRMLSNLIDNALKYGTACRVGLVALDTRITVTIEDNGPGVAAEDLAHLRRPFFRASEARTLTEDGHGLGLAIANEIALRHEGWLELANTLEGFSCSVTLKRP